MAQGYKNWAAGDTLTAADLEDYTVLQSIMRFADAATRSSNISPTEGYPSLLLDTNTIGIANGSDWSSVGPVYGALTAYTPAIGGSGWALGNGTAVGAYARLGRMVFVRAVITWGGTSSFGAGGLTLTLPVAASIASQSLVGVLGDTGTANYPALLNTAAASSTATVLALNAGSTYLAYASVTTSAPHTWVSTDTVTFNGCYEANADG